MKVNLSQNLALKLGPNENYCTEELVGISWIEFKLLISFWKRFDLYLPLLKPKKPSSFFTSLFTKANENIKYETKSQSKGLEVRSQW